MNQINLQTIANGELQEKFTAALSEVFENMLDPNTPYKACRGITVKLKFTQNEARDDVRCEVVVDTKLAPRSATTTGFVVQRNLKTGKISAHEYGKQVAGQMELDQPVPQVDESTGEVIGEVIEVAPGVVDFRATAAN